METVIDLKQAIFSNIEYEKNRLYQLSITLTQINMGEVRGAIVEACIQNAIASLNDAVHALDNPVEDEE